MVLEVPTGEVARKVLAEEGFPPREGRRRIPRIQVILLNQEYIRTRR